MQPHFKDETEVAMKTLIVGSTGMVGSRVAVRFLDKGEAIRCMSRSPEKMKNLPDGIERVVADLNRPHTLGDAFKGVDNVFLLLSIGRNEIEQCLNAVRAAKAGGVKKIVYLSVYRPGGSDMIPHFGNKIPVENAITSSGIVYTILRPNNFFQNDASIIGVVTSFGIYPTPIGQIGLNRVDVRDVADGAVNAVTQPGHEGRIYNIHGPETLTGRDTARIYSRYAGRNVRYAGDDLDNWVQHVKNVMPEWLYRDMRVMYKYFQNNGMIAPEADLEKQMMLLGHEPRSFDLFARELVEEWKRTLACAA
jgi:uncharacterized protein YbjT (DUF2867 family)